ncbi:MAG: hypothetical protein ACK5UE_04470 [Chitinophagales bacterium]|nr:hypothetical protein [Sphingobacteriales bacterium]
MVTIKSYAQWNPLGPKTTNADLNIGGMQFGRFHIKHNQLPLMAAEIGGASNGHQNVLSLSKEVGNSLSLWPNPPSSTITSIPTWGFAIDNQDNGLRFTYTDLINQPSTIWSWNGSSMTPTPILTWPNVREVFSIIPTR